MLFDTYQKISGRFPDGCQHLFGGKVDGVDGFWLALDAKGFPHLLFATPSVDGLPDLQLKSVRVHFACPCDIHLETGDAVTGVYTVISLASDDIDIIRVFLRLLEEAFLSPGADISAIAVRDNILTIADVFSRLSDDVRDVLGLWGELYIILSAPNIQAAARAWASSPKAKYDFLTENYALEVKTTLKSARQHRFALDQLRPGPQIDVYVASILLFELPSGQTASELIDQIYESISQPDEKSRFFRSCLRKGGADIYSSDLRLGTFPNGTSLAIYYAKDISVPEISPASLISRVKFDVDITGARQTEPSVKDIVLAFDPDLSPASIQNGPDARVETCTPFAT